MNGFLFSTGVCINYIDQYTVILFVWYSSLFFCFICLQPDNIAMPHAQVSMKHPIFITFYISLQWTCFQFFILIIYSFSHFGHSIVCDNTVTNSLRINLLLTNNLNIFRRIFNFAFKLNSLFFLLSKKSQSKTREGAERARNIWNEIIIEHA